MRRQTDNKPGGCGLKHDATRHAGAAANYMNSILITRARIYISSHLDAPRTASSQCFLDDADIAATVKDAIGCVVTVLDGALQVDVKNGWVTLRGKLDSWQQRASVERIALHSIGVRGVINSITVDQKPVTVV